ncbi:MAG: FHA domain-containing protein [Synechococcaceae cyanobacterium ELA182]
MNGQASLVLRQDPTRVAGLDRSQPLTIGRAANNRLCLSSFELVAPHHAVVRFSRSHGWLVCDWGSPQGTWLEGRRFQQCRPLADGDEIQLGQQGPVLIFRQAAATPAPKAAAKTPATVEVGGRALAPARVRSAFVRSQRRYPQIFSWWALLCLGGLLLLPLPWLFWPWQIAALVGWVVLGSRKQHTLVVTLGDGMAYRQNFASKTTALAHRNGIRQAIGQSLDA